MVKTRPEARGDAIAIMPIRMVRIPHNFPLRDIVSIAWEDSFITVLLERARQHIAAFTGCLAPEG
jgi:hypothetical protein